MNYSEQNNSLAQNIIGLQKEQGQPRWIFEEIGANTKVSTTLQECSWSSAVIHKAVCNYHPEEQVWNPKNEKWKQQWRSVSPEFINAGLDYYTNLKTESYLLKFFNFLRSKLLSNSVDTNNKLNKSLFMNSFQTEDDPTKVTHWRIWIKNNSNKTLYHLTIPDHYDRPTFQKIVWNIWLQLITQCLDPAFQVTTPYIDHVYDENKQNIQKTIDLMQKDSVVCINASGQLCRIEDITRTREWYQPMIICKWSFNPLHKGHLHIMESMQKKYPNHRAFFSISVNNFDKWDVLSDEIQQRIVMLNTLWYPVLLFWSALFKDNLDRLRLKNDKEIIFPVWSDTVERIFKTYNDKNQMINDFERVRFESFWREQFQFDSGQYEELFIQNDENPYSLVSSSTIIKNITENLHNIPEKIHDLCIKKYWQNL